MTMTRIPRWRLRLLLILVLQLLHYSNGASTDDQQLQRGNSKKTNNNNLRWLVTEEENDNTTTTTTSTAADPIVAPSPNGDDDGDGGGSGGICPPCPLQCPEQPPVQVQCPVQPPKQPGAANATTTEEEPLVLQILVVDSPGIITMVKWNADDYFKFTNGRVKVEIRLAPTMPSLFEEIENSARAGGGLYDAYYTNPVILGSAAMLGGFLDLTEYVKQSPYSDWTDVLLALRTYVTSFEDKIYIILLDGDTHTLFYRKDVLNHFGLKPPRTWNEYNQVAAKVHGAVFNNITLSGSCVSRIQGDHAMYWYHLVLSTITQTQGTHEGSLFDTKDMSPLSGAAMEEMLRIHQTQAQYGTFDEYSDIINHVQNGHMNDGSCAMTFMWGDMFRRSKAEGSILHDKLGIAPTPGSEWVLDRSTGNLEKCTKERCPYAIYYDDLGWVNSAPYAANGGWGAAVSAHTTPEKQKALAEFFLWASSRQQSQQYVIPNATLPWYEINGQDPWRKSQLDVEKWVAQGFDRELSKQYVMSILTNLVSKNVVVEARFPKAGEIMSVLDKEVNEYLVRAHKGLIAPEDYGTEREQTADEITRQWNQIIRAYNQRGDTVVPILEIYQRLRGVYVPNEQKNYLTRARPLGWTMVVLVYASSFAAAIWVYWKRAAVVVRASQPPFLMLICAGTIIMGSSIITMGVDESIASPRGCDVACQITPWLVALGFSVIFAALASKILRLKTLMENAAQFRRVNVRVQDVMKPFVIIVALNTIFLTIWTVVDPLYWERIQTGRTETGELSSYGRCTASGNVSVIMLGLIGGINALALLAANILAYQTREMTVAFNESKYVGFSVGSILQAMLIGTPLLFLADSNPTARYFVRSVLIFVICMSVQVFIFVPKVLKGDQPLVAAMPASRFSMVGAPSGMTGSHLQSSGTVSRPFGSLRASGPTTTPRNTINTNSSGADFVSDISSAMIGKGSSTADAPSRAFSVNGSAAATKESSHFQPPNITVAAAAEQAVVCSSNDDGKAKEEAKKDGNQ